MRPRRQPDSDGGCRARRAASSASISPDVRSTTHKRSPASSTSSNIELRHASILDVDASYGEFDYIICHGVYAWVPREVQDKILSIYAEHLTPNGVGHVSYNTYPGWHFRGMVREMLVYHSSGFTDPPTRIAAAKAMLGFLAQSAGQESPYGRILNAELDLLAKLPDYYLFHEHLEPDNQTALLPRVRRACRRRGPAVSRRRRSADDGPLQLSRRGAAGPPQALEQRRPSRAVHGLPPQPDVPAELAGEAGRPALTLTHAGEPSQGLRVASSAEVDGSPDGPELQFRGRTNETLTTGTRC